MNLFIQGAASRTMLVQNAKTILFLLLPDDGS